MGFELVQNPAAHAGEPPAANNQGAHKQGAKNVVDKVKDTLTGH